VLPSPLLTTPNFPRPQPIIFVYPELPPRFAIYAYAVSEGRSYYYLLVVDTYSCVQWRGKRTWQLECRCSFALVFIQLLMHRVAEYPIAWVFSNCPVLEFRLF
jgi:hypothetical protein